MNTDKSNGEFIKGRHIHTAEIKKAKSTDEKVLKGEFSVVNGKLSFTCHTQNVSFDEVLIGIKLLRDECQRQIDNQERCPFHPINNHNHATNN